ncbi:Sugar phosphate isomerase/epimerase [Paenibacillus algorifonticola]|uniref:Sugar phosphate isomerase/epimerase n=1 Tax=Paenibacillus algorifonticola TaxID=684063 RepID=A0A1I2I5G1_9BACL|nr:sugar phosphate isomerase/epimerase family protein [Paenibacillus algorifonticola]SFF37709.1 Sugar phosphate isomerase/epimerase [Paenibacillus algorifonticola]
MKLAVTIVQEASQAAPFVLRGNFEASIKKAAEIGYDAVELHIADPSEVNLEAIQTACSLHGVSVSSIGTGLAFLRDRITLTHPDADVRKEAIKRMLSFIQFASKLDCVVIIGLIKGIIKDNGDGQHYHQLLNEAMLTCIAAAEQAEVTLVVEAVNRYESDFLNTIEESIIFVDRFHSERLKIHIDTFHMNMEEDSAGANIKKAGKRIGHVHIADSNRRYPGKGHYDFSETISALKEIGYSGALSVECLSLPTPVEAATGAHHFMRGLL